MQLKGRRKIFFFEKKKQKTFVLLTRAGDKSATAIKSFLVLFSKKEHLSSAIFLNTKNVFQQILRTNIIFQSGIEGLDAVIPISIKLTNATVVHMLSEILGVTEWSVVRGPDSLQLK